jgi:hypothetical protein
MRYDETLLTDLVAAWLAIGPVDQSAAAFLRDNARQATPKVLFHGTLEEFDGPLRAGAFDNLLWTARCPALAQAYIPPTGGSILLSMSAFRADERLRPTLDWNGRPSGWYALAVQLGYPESPEIEVNRYGEPESWIIPEGWPTNGELVRDLGTMGYAIDNDRGDFFAWVKTVYRPGPNGGSVEVFLPADHCEMGRLFLIAPDRPLTILDRGEGDGDLQNPAHLDFETFEAAQAAGYDGLQICDFLQSEAAGNVGHLSTGLFPEALGDLRYMIVPAPYFEVADDLSAVTTPAFETAWAEALENARSMDMEEALAL